MRRVEHVLVVEDRAGGSPPAVVVEGLTVRYGSRTVIDDLSVGFPARRWTAVIGRNGVGKSTLLSAIVGFGPGAERVRFPGRRGRRSRFLAYVPQTPVLPPGMTVAEYVLLGRSAHLGWLASEGPEDRERAGWALTQMNLGDLAGRRLSELSGGEAQRTVLARALCQDAEILVMDEPTSSLDVGHQIEVMELVGRLAAEHDLTVISALHDLTAAARYGHDVMILDGGRLVAQGPPEVIMEPERLTRHFGTPVFCTTDDDGSAIIVPLSPPRNLP